MMILYLSGCLVATTGRFSLGVNICIIYTNKKAKLGQSCEIPVYLLNLTRRYNGPPDGPVEAKRHQWPGLVGGADAVYGGGGNVFHLQIVPGDDVSLKRSCTENAPQSQ
jgi:hypothetical protein